jgi:WD40 repeat protein
MRIWALVWFFLIVLPNIFGQQVELTTKTGHAASIRSMMFSPNGKYLVTIGDDRTARLWEVKSGQELRSFGGHSTAITALAFSPNSQKLATVSHGDGVARIWDVETGKELWILGNAHPGTVLGDRWHTISFSPNGKYLAVGKSEDGPERVTIADVEPPPPAPRLGESNTDFKARVMTASEDWKQAEKEKVLLRYAIDVWNVDTGGKARELKGHTSNVPFVLFSSDGETVISGSDDRTIRLWDFETGIQRKTLGPLPERIEYLTTSQHNRFLACIVRSNSNVYHRRFFPEAGEIRV